VNLPGTGELLIFYALQFGIALAVFAIEPVNNSLVPTALEEGSLT
jgi:hypothetical protein